MSDESYLGEFVNNSATQPLVSAFQTAISLAESSGVRVYLAHIAVSLLDDANVQIRLTKEVDLKVRADLAREILSLEPSGVPGSLAFRLATLVEPARNLASALGAAKVSPLIFLATCVSADVELDSISSRCREIVRNAGVTGELLGAKSVKSDARRQDYTYRSLGFGTDLTAMARAGVWETSPLVGMEEELITLATLLGTGSACVVGEPGVGKTAFVEGFAWRIGTKDRTLIPDSMHSWTIVMIQSTELLAGMGIQGQLEERIQNMISFFRRNRTVIPFFDEVHRLLDTEDATAKTISTAIKGPMARGEFRCVACTTDKEYARHIANDDAMKSRLPRFLLPEPDQATARLIIKGSKTNILNGRPAELGIDIHDDGIEEAVRITSVHLRTDRLPRKAIDLLRRTATQKVRDIEMARGSAVSTIIGTDDVLEAYSKISRRPKETLNSQRPEYYTKLRSELSARVMGQRQPIEDVVSHLELHTRGWVRPGRPRGRFLFLGPPGVGKTELAMALADAEMRQSGSMIVMNMAEYHGQTAVSKFMGADPSYVGFGQTATLYSQVMMRTYSVVILDEFEKSNSSLANPLISIFDGSAQDSQARTVDFSQCIFVMTSNEMAEPGGALEAEIWPRLDEMELAKDDKQKVRLRDSIEEDIRRHLCTLEGIWTRPLVDRIDRISVFRPLNRTVLSDILNASIESLRARSVIPFPREIDDDAIRQDILDDAISDEGYASARRLERALQRWLSTWK